MSKLRVLFLGTPDFAAVILRKLLDWPQGSVAGVITQPDRKAGRGRKMTPPPVKVLAQEYGLHMLQPETLQSKQALDFIQKTRADVLVVAAYGLMIPRAILSATRYGALNVHASLLPRYRGAAPIQRAIINGETVTGISIIQMEAGLDSGPVLNQKAMAIGQEDTAQTLHDQLAVLGGDCLTQTLENITSVRGIPQDDRLATYAPKLSKEDGLINWNLEAHRVHAHIRGVFPWPGAFFFWKRPRDGKTIRLGIFPGAIGPRLEKDIPPGEPAGLQGEALRISCLDRYYLVKTIQPASSGRPLTAREFSRGYI
ncbi:MAG: methionyl-tRNA formyltransferase [Desulfohalobiaceae bacterium]|nr:methionyl-tRNA formyltransferase [Desulfohalobiaceae bacterium]